MGPTPPSNTSCDRSAGEEARCTAVAPYVKGAGGTLHEDCGEETGETVAAANVPKLGAIPSEAPDGVAIGSVGHAAACPATTAQRAGA